MTVAGWKSNLDPGDKALWPGGPDGQIMVRPMHVIPFLYRLLFAGFTLFGMVMALKAGGWFRVFGLVPGLCRRFQKGAA